MTARPLLGLALVIAGGALAGPTAGRSAAFVLLALAALLLFLALRARRPAASIAAVLGAGIGVGAAAAAAERLAYDAAPLGPWLANGEDGEPVLLHGTAASDGREVDGRLVVVVDVTAARIAGEERPFQGRVRLDVWGESARPAIRLGDRLSAWAVLRRPRGFANPGSFDTEGHARRSGIHAFASCKSGQLLALEGQGDAGWLA